MIINLTHPIRIFRVVVVVLTHSVVVCDGGCDKVLILPLDDVVGVQILLFQSLFQISFLLCLRVGALDDYL